MLSVLRSTIIEASVEEVWPVISDFNSHHEWHPAIAASVIERGLSSEQVGCVRRFNLVDGAELREQLLTLSELEMSYSYCLLDTPIPLFNYIAHVRLVPITDTDHTFWEWQARFNTRRGDEAAMQQLVGDTIFTAGFDAFRHYLTRQNGQAA